MKISKDQLERVVIDWGKIAQETVTVEGTDIESPIYAFGSELACLRLHYTLKVGRVEYSTNLDTWYYSNK